LKPQSVSSVLGHCKPLAIQDGKLVHGRLHRDHLGSVDAVTSASGVLLNEKTSFDPFGARRQHSWANDITTASLNTLLASEQLRFQRGFTDHEQLNRTGFVHMKRPWNSTPGGTKVRRILRAVRAKLRRPVCGGKWYVSWCPAIW
jgi:hypothetical protein